MKFGVSHTFISLFLCVIIGCNMNGSTKSRTGGGLWDILLMLANCVAQSILYAAADCVKSKAYRDK